MSRSSGIPAGIAAAIAIAAVLGGCTARAPESVRTGPANYSTPSALPAPRVTGGMSLDQALATRRSGRAFTMAALPIAEVGQLLWAGQGLTSADGKRTAPSAGGLTPIELYAVTDTRVMHYLPSGHRVESRNASGLQHRLQAAAFDQTVVGRAPEIVAIAAAYDRTTAKYGARGRAYADLEAGHVAQNILLEATALHLAAVPVGGIDGKRTAHVLNLPPDETVLYLIPVGPPA